MKHLLSLTNFVTCSVVLIVGLLVSTARAQETSATISGSIVDANGSVVVGARVSVTNDNQGLRRETTSNIEGYYKIPFLPPGSYTLSVEMTNFATIRVANIALQPSTNTAVNVVMEVKGFVEAVNVNAQTNLIDTSSSSVKFSVTNEQVGGLPVLATVSGRNVLGLLPFLVPGVAPTDVFGSSRDSNSDGRSMSINGARPESNSYNFAGGNNNDNETNGSATPMPNPDALQEFTILTNSYPADQGRGVGGIINAVAKSGTNQFHGNVRYIGINDALNARGFFDTAKPVSRLHTFGGQLGGPISVPSLYDGRERSFFFVDYEGTRSHSAPTFTFPNVLTRNERAGNFSALSAAQRPRDPLTGQPFPGGVIPTERISPLSQAYLNQFVPLADGSGRTFRTQTPRDLGNDGVTANFTHRLGDNDTLGVTVLYNKSSNRSNFGALPLELRHNFPVQTWNVVLNETHTFSSQVVNQLTISGTRAVSERFTTAPGFNGVSPSAFGFTGIRPQTERYLAIPSISVTGTSLRLDPRNPIFNEHKFKTLWQARDDLSYVRNNHSLKFGADIRGFIINSFRGNNNGGFTFSTSTTARTRNAIADFLLGLPASFNQSTGNTMYPRQKAFYFYGMDDWRVRSNLTFNMGLRYELAPPLKDELEQLIVFRPGETSRRFPTAPEGVLFAGDPDPLLGTVPGGGYRTDKNNFAPRVGIAYSPKPKAGWWRTVMGDQKTAIRAAWGVFYDATLGATFLDNARIQPFAVSQTITAAQLAAAGGTFANPYGNRPNPFPLDLSQRQFVGFPELQPFDPNFRTAYTYQYNLTIQRELPGSLLLEVAYVGSNSFKQNRERELNPALVDDTASVDNVQERRIFPELGTIPSQESSGRARYDSAQLTLTRRFTGGMSFGVSYVFQKALDTVSTSFIDFTPGATGWARSDFDRTHGLVVNYTYDLPDPKRTGFAGLVLNGWSIGGVTQIRSGQPLDINQTFDPTLTSDGFLSGAPDFVGPYERLDPRRFQTIVVDGVPSSGNFFFNPNAFRAVPVDDPSQARPGTLGRNVFNGPAINQWDLSIIKRVNLFESHRFELRSDIRNLFNQALFDNPDTTVDSPTFGRVLLSGPGRTIQFAVRYSF